MLLRTSALTLSLLASGIPLLRAQIPAGAATSVPRSYAPTLPRSYSPTLPRAATEALYPWRRGITATVFWVGEDASANNPTHNRASAWDTEWQKNFGGYDTPDRTARTRDFCPHGFTPQLNPFYVALPYNDRIDWRSTKPSAPRVVPWFDRVFEREGQSVCHNRWVAIHHGGRVCFAQWCDVGPFETDDWAYVFGNARPKNTKNNGAGIDLSPAVRDYLGIAGGRATVDWRFVEVREIPVGPWRKYGENNYFVDPHKHMDRAQREEIERLKRLRDQAVRSRLGG